jgi:hypothetical protein
MLILISVNNFNLRYTNAMSYLKYFHTISVSQFNVGIFDCIVGKVGVLIFWIIILLCCGLIDEIFGVFRHVDPLGQYVFFDIL